MSNEQFSWEKPLGIITQYDEITFGDNANIGEDKNPVPKSRTKYTLDDIYILLRKLKGMIDPKNIERIERIVVKHVNDKNNPHNVTIDQLTTSVMNELYIDFLNYQNRTKYDNKYTLDELKKLISSEQFLKLLYQDIKIADIETILEGTSTDTLVTPSGINELINIHNNDPNAHEKLFDYLIPGTMETYMPTLSLVAACDIFGGIFNSDFIQVYKKSDYATFYMDNNGKINHTFDNFIPVDYSTGKAAYPFFDIYNNYCTHSYDFSNTKFIKTNVSVINNKSSITSMLDEQQFGVIYSNKIISTTNSETLKHKISYSINASEMETKSPKNLCISVFVKSGTISNIAINVYQDIEKEHNAYHYNLDTCKTYCIEDEIDKNIYATINETPNGWKRLTYICPINNTKNATIDIYLLDIFDGDLTFIGDESKYCFIEGLQIEFDNDLASPYIPTNGEIGESGGLFCSFKHTTKINYFQSGYFFECLINNQINRNKSRYIVSLSDKNNKSIVNSFYTVTANAPLHTTISNSNGNVILDYPFSQLNSNEYNKYCFGFACSGSRQVTTDGSIPETPKKPEAIFNDTSENLQIKELTEDPNSNNVKTITIGAYNSGSLFLNGYISEFVYYPSMPTEGHTIFFIRN